MGSNTSGLKRDAGPGRPRGCRDKVPKSFKASIKHVFEDIAATDPALIRKAILKGLKGRPREAFPYVQLAAAYIDGKPADTVNITGNQAPVPWVVVLAPETTPTGDPEA
jgi:hypothetical protein